MTGSVEDKRFGDERYLKVFVPTPPNPTSGTMVLARESQTRDPGWTLEEALKTVISGGIIGPEEFREPKGPEAPVCSLRRCASVSFLRRLIHKPEHDYFGNPT